MTSAFTSGAIGRGGGDPALREPGLNVEAVPVRHGDQVVAVLTHQTALAERRTSSPLEKAYLDCAGNLLHMVSEGTFPNVGDLAVSRSSPRVGDGFIRLDVDGVVVYASPNALSAYHRMGLSAELEGHNLMAITRPLISDPFEAQELAEHVRDSLAGGSSMRMEVDAGGAAMLLRTLPLVVHGAAAGAAMLIRDVTEVKRRDRALLSKDATIREIHHRVKNNLQTVAALLRLQARRTNNEEGREALMESVRRVAVDRAGARGAVDVGGRGGQPRRGHRPDPADHERRGQGRRAHPDQPGGRRWGCSTPTGPPPWSWSSPSWFRTPSSTPSSRRPSRAA